MLLLTAADGMSKVLRLSVRLSAAACAPIPHADCIEVTAATSGLVYSRVDYRAVACALALPELPTADR